MNESRQRAVTVVVRQICSHTIVSVQGNSILREWVEKDILRKEGCLQNCASLDKQAVVLIASNVTGQKTMK